MAVASKLADLLKLAKKVPTKKIPRNKPKASPKGDATMARFEKAMEAEAKIKNIERVGPSHPDYDKLPSLNKAAEDYRKGGMVTKSNKGNMDYRKGGLVLSSIDNRKKKK
jgi:hypothetical protein